jgi:Right handed beta helix region
MTRKTFIAAALALAAVLPAIPAQATLLTRTFVSSAGKDSNPCTITQPCATFAVAYAATAANGIIAALDPGKYGPVTIMGPVTINGYGWAAITGPASGNAITINANSSDKIALIGLEIDGANAASDGIQFNSGGSLSVRDSTIRNFQVDGITLNAEAPVSISDTVVSNNSNFGIDFQPGGTADLTLERVQAIGNSNIGILIEGKNAPPGAAVTGTCADCVLSGNGDGFSIEGFLISAQPTVMIVNCKIVNNNIGLALSDSTVNLAQSTISNNKTDGFSTQFGTLKSFGNNFITDTTNVGNLMSIAQR